MMPREEMFAACGTTLRSSFNSMSNPPLAQEVRGGPTGSTGPTTGYIRAASTIETFSGGWRVDGLLSRSKFVGDCHQSLAEACSHLDTQCSPYACVITTTRSPALLEAVGLAYGPASILIMVMSPALAFIATKVHKAQVHKTFAEKVACVEEGEAAEASRPAEAP